MLRIIGIAFIVAWFALFFRRSRDERNAKPASVNITAELLFGISTGTWFVWSVIVSLGWRSLHTPYLLHIAIGVCVLGVLFSVASSVYLYRGNTEPRLALTILSASLGIAQLLGAIRTVFMMLNG